MHFNIHFIFFVGVLCCSAANGTATPNTTTTTTTTEAATTTPAVTTTLTITSTAKPPTSTTSTVSTAQPTKSPTTSNPTTSNPTTSNPTTSTPTTNPTRKPTSTTTKRPLQLIDCVIAVLFSQPRECLKLINQARMETKGPWSKFVAKALHNETFDFCACYHAIEKSKLSSQSPAQISDLPAGCFGPYKSECKISTKLPKSSTTTATQKKGSTSTASTVSTSNVSTSRSPTNATAPAATSSTTSNGPKVNATQPPVQTGQGNLTTFLMIGGVIVCLFGAVLYCLKSREAGDESLLNARRRGGGNSGYDRQGTLSQDSGSDTDENLMMPQHPRRKIGTEVVGALSGAIETIASKVPRRPKPKKQVVVRPPSASGGYQAARDDDVGTELTGVSVHQTPKFGLGDSDDEESSESDEELLAIAERRRAKKREREMKKKGQEKKKKKKKSTKSSRERDETVGGQDFDPRGDGGDLFEFAPDCDE